MLELRHLAPAAGHVRGALLAQRQGRRDAKAGAAERQIIQRVAAAGIRPEDDGGGGIAPETLLSHAGACVTNAVSSDVSRPDSTGNDTATIKPAHRQTARPVRSSRPRQRLSISRDNVPMISSGIAALIPNISIVRAA